MNLELAENSLSKRTAGKTSLRDDLLIDSLCYNGIKKLRCARPVERIAFVFCSLACHDEPFHGVPVCHLKNPSF
jgi:hypothetical protein